MGESLIHDALLVAEELAARGECGAEADEQGCPICDAIRRIRAAAVAAQVYGA